MQYFFLSAEQQGWIAEHLGEVLTGFQLQDALAAIDMACDLAAAENRMTPRQRTEHRTRHSADYEHFTTLAKHATELRERLQAKRPLIGTAGLDWPTFDETLAALTESAHKEADARRPRPERGRPPEHHRDGLISIVFNAYPPGTAKRTIGSHFERTIELLFQFLGRDLQDVHGLIVEALRRCPDPPFTVTLHR